MNSANDEIWLTPAMNVRNATSTKPMITAAFCIATMKLMFFFSSMQADTTLIIDSTRPFVAT